MSLDAAAIRDTERERLRSLVHGDMAAAGALHADDYQLITPSGTPLTKAAYLGGIASGEMRYLVFEPATEIAVRLGAGTAVLRYQAHIKVQEGDESADLMCWHTDNYELRSGRWQAVWSQATAISPE